MIRTTGSVQDLPKSEKHRTATSDDNMTIAESVIQSPKKSLHKRSTEFDVPLKSVHHIMQSLKLKPYHPQMH